MSALAQAATGRLPRPQAGAPVVTAIADPAALTALAEEPARLWDEIGTPAVFMTVEWLQAWRQHFGAGRAWRVLIVREGGELMAVAPLVVDRAGGIARVWRLPGHPISDYRDFLLPADVPRRTRALRAILDYVVSHRREWDLLDLADLPEESGTVDALRPALAEAGLRWVLQDTYRCPFVDLSGPTPRGLKGRDGKSLHNLTRSWRRLEQRGPLVLTHRSDAADVERVLPRLVDQHRRLRERNGIVSPFASGAGLAFLTDITQRFARRGWLDVVTLELADTCLAFSYSLVHGSRYYYYVTGYDPEFSAFSPGILLLSRLIDRVQADGLREFDFTKGDETYKDRWATGARRNRRLTIAAPGPRGAIALWGHQVYSRVHQWGRTSPAARRLYRLLPRRAVRPASVAS